MKRLYLAAGVVLLMLFSMVLTADARPSHHDWRGEVIIGPVWSPWWGPYAYSYPYAYRYPSPDAYPYDYRDPEMVIERDPPAYFQQAEGPKQQQYYWYYCKNPKGYYPYVKSCPDGWKKVLPAPPSDGKE